MERKWFEAWYQKQFNQGRELLKKDSDSSYSDPTINAMFIGFAAGWNCK